MKLIVGLGNPDMKYQNTFHNLGFMCADKTCEKLGLTFSKTKCKASIAEGKVGKEKIIIAKPLTYMNLSGESVFELLSFYKTDLKDLLVLYDDFDIPKGSVRLREEGSAGTHNGMRNIVSVIKSQDFKRIRVGFKPEEMKGELIDYVLSGIKKEDKAIFDKAIERVADACVDFVKGEDFNKIMQHYNGEVK